MVTAKEPPLVVCPASPVRLGSRTVPSPAAAGPRLAIFTEATTLGTLGLVGVVGRSGIQVPVPSGLKRAAKSVPRSSRSLLRLLLDRLTNPLLTNFQTCPPRRSSPI